MEVAGDACRPTPSGWPKRSDSPRSSFFLSRCGRRRAILQVSKAPHRRNFRLAQDRACHDADLSSQFLITCLSGISAVG